MIFVKICLPSRFFLDSVKDPKESYLTEITVPFPHKLGFRGLGKCSCYFLDCFCIQIVSLFVSWSGVYLPI